MKRTSYMLLRVLLFVGIVGCGKDKYRQPSAELYYQEAQEALHKAKCYKAQQLFQNLLSDFPGSHLVDEAQYGLGQSYLCMKDFVTARFEFERLLNEYPVSPFADEARYQIGMCYYRESRDIHHDQTETLQAIRSFGRFIEDYPTSELARDAEARIRELRGKLAAKSLTIARSYIKWKSYASAQLYCEEVLEEYQDTDSVNPARFLLAQTKYKLGKLDEALEDLMALATDSISEDLRQEVVEEVRRVQEEIAGRAPAQASPDTARVSQPSQAGD